MTDAIRNGAWHALGIPYNPQTALVQKALELKLGRPVTAETPIVVEGVKYTYQGFEGGILCAQDGEGNNITVLPWM